MFVQKNKYIPFVMWLFPLSFFAYQFILRLWPGLMMHQIMAQFTIDASHFGLLGAFYYYGYAGMQIPVAIFLDRFGARSVIFAFAMMCGLATILFTYTDNFALALLSRFLIGAGSGVGFLGVSKVLSQWFPKEQYTRMVGYTFSFGLLGAIYGGKPVNALIEAYGCQNVAFVLSIISIFIGCGAYLVLRSPQSVKAEEQETAFKMTNFKALLSNPIIWFLAVANLLMVGPLEGFADVWGVSYLMTAYGIDKGAAAGLVSFIYVGMLFGGPLLAFSAKKGGNYLVIAACGVGMTLAFGWLLLFMDTYSWWVLACLFFVVGALCCYQVIVFAAGSDLVASRYLVLVVAFLNSINMFGGSYFHTLIGKVMDLFWTGALSSDGLRQYDLVTYRYALCVIPLCAIVGSVIVCFVGLKVTGLGLLPQKVIKIR